MNFNKHLDIRGQHAFLGASKYHWINYDDEKLITTYYNFLAVEKGTKLHELASTLIDMKVNLPKSKKTLNMYVNDAIGYHMTTEQPLFYSYNCFGTADAISFRNNFLRIHDLKTGSSPTHIEQLEIYAALFCLEYELEPIDIHIELRIYQNNEILIVEPEAEAIKEIMNKIIFFDELINKVKTEESNG